MRQYRQYRLTGNKGSSRPQLVLYLDTETKQRYRGNFEDHRLLLGWSCFVRSSEKDRQTVSWRYWEGSYELCKYIDSVTRDKTALYIFAHNVYFDLQVSDFYHYFTKWGWQLVFTYDQGLTYILVIKKGRKTIKVLSTTNYFPYSLAEIGNLMGLPKLGVDFKNTDKPELSTYCKRDVEIIKEAMEYWWSFLDEHDLGNFALTRASQAMTAYRHRFLYDGLTYCDDTDVKEWERQAYFGGRVECFELGHIRGGPFVTLDVNSMYPFVMKTREYPVRFLSYSDQPREDLLDYNLEKYCVIAKVDLETDEPAYPVMEDNKLIFPTGCFTTYLCSQGVRYALEHGHLRKVHEIAYYEKAYIFADFVDFFTGLKVEYSRSENWLMRDMVKIILNSLYGKFGQKKPITEEEDDITYDGYWREEIADLISGEMLTVTKLFNKRYTTNGFTSGKKSMPSIAAHVTEYARFYLWEIIKKIGRDNVLYCDTDGVKVREKDLEGLDLPMDDYKLGSLKVENRMQSLTLYGPKDYETDTGFHAKGVPQSAEKVSAGVYRYTLFPRQSTHLRKRINRWFETETITKVLSRRYDKGQVQPTGRVIPFVIRSE